MDYVIIANAAPIGKSKREFLQNWFRKTTCDLIDRTSSINIRNKFVEKSSIGSYET